MAPNRGGERTSYINPVTAATAEQSSVISSEEVAARGSGTKEDKDTYPAMTWPSNETRVFFTGLMFLTRLPCPGWCDHHPAFLMRSTAYFPVIGAIVGLWGGVFFSAAAALWDPSIAAALSTLATVWLTGCFHEDGLADCFDGFGGGWGRTQILRIMKDSRVGTYALVGTTLCLYQKLQLLSCFPVAHTPRLLLAAHVASRWTSMPLLYGCNYIQDEEDAKKGLYNWFAQSQRLLTPTRLAGGTGSTIAIVIAAVGWHHGLLVIGATILVMLLSSWYGTTVIGGVVGDFLGATIQVAELVVYLVLSADWSRLQDFECLCSVLIFVAVVMLPVLYSRKIVDFGTTSC